MKNTLILLPDLRGRASSTYAIFESCRILMWLMTNCQTLEGGKTKIYM